MTLAEFLPEYEKDHLRLLKPETQALYRSTLTRYVLPELGERPLADLTLRVLRDTFNALESRVAPNTARLAKTILSTVLSEAVALGYLESNPCPQVRIKGGKVRERRALSNADIKALLAECDEEVRLLLQMALTTGLRISELLGLTWEDVDTKRGTVKPARRIYRGRPDERLKTEKSGRERSLGNLRLTPESGPIFTSTYDSLQKRLVAAARRTGAWIPGFGFHYFRSLYVSRLQEKGASALEAACFVGHGKPAITHSYTEPQLSRLASLVQAIQTDFL